MKRICAVLLVLSLSLSPFGNLDVKAAEEVKPEVQVLTVNSEAQLYQNYDVLNDVNVIHTKQDTFKKMDVEVVKEVLDNGTDFLVNDANLEQMEELFETPTSLVEEGKQEIACYITADNADYSVLPVYADVLYEEEESVEDAKYKEDAEKLYQYVTNNKVTRAISDVKDSEVNAEELYQMTKEKNNDNFLNQLPEEDLVTLQTSTLIGESFTESSKLVYFYKEGSASGTGTDYIYSTNTTKAGWSKMGSLNMAIYGIRVRTNDNVTFDNIYSVVAATGINDKYVKQFTVNVSVPELSTNVIMDETTSTGSIYSATGKLATSVSATGAVSGYTSYSYNTGTQNISTAFGKKYERTWNCYPRTFVENGTYRVRPGILVKKTDGKTTAITGTVSVDTFQVSGGIRNYTIKDTVKCSIKFKNHVEV